MAKGFIHISTSGNGDLRYFAREGECSHILSSANLPKEKGDLLEHWKSIEQQEKLGDKALGIRGRHDAQIRKNYILSLPNELSPQQGAERVKHLVEQTPIQHCSYSIFVHRGEKDGITNQHVHLIVNERNLQTMKKDREMIKKDFLERTIRPLFAKEFAAEHKQGKTLVTRERIEESLYYAAPELARKELEQKPTISGDLSAFEQLTQVMAQRDLAREFEKLSALMAERASQKEQEEKEKQAQQEKVKQEQQEPKQGRSWGIGR